MTPRHDARGVGARCAEVAGRWGSVRQSGRVLDLGGVDAAAAVDPRDFVEFRLAVYRRATRDSVRQIGRVMGLVGLAGVGGLTGVEATEMAEPLAHALRPGVEDPLE